MPLVDWIVLAIFLLVTLAAGLSLAGRSQRVEDYFLGNRRVGPALALLSIVATETSAVTFLSVPAHGFRYDLRLLQLPLGYIVGRTAVAYWLLPALFDRPYLTLYQRFQTAFGRSVQQLTSGLFVATRTVADGLRLYLTAILVGTMLSVPLDWAVLVVAVVTIAYAFVGGIRAVLWTDAIQLVVYLFGAVLALGLLMGGRGETLALLDTAARAGKLRVFDFSLSLSDAYTFWAGVVGGAFLSAATHGADQLMVQRYLCTGSLGRARFVLVASGIVVFLQFALFLLIGVGLWYRHQASADDLVRADEVFVRFILDEMPVGARGVVIAAALAAAMSTLSSSVNSIASAVVGDLARPAGGEEAERPLARSRWATVLAGVAQGTVAVAAIHYLDKDSPVIGPILTVASLTTGVVLGLLVLSSRRGISSRAAAAAFCFGLSASLVCWGLTPLAFPWLSVVGVVSTAGAGWVCRRWMR